MSPHPNDTGTKEAHPHQQLQEESIENKGEQLARQHHVAPKARPRFSPQRHIKELERFLERVHQRFTGAPEEVLALSYAAEWVLDNYYIIQQNVRQIRKDLPTGYYYQLPKLESLTGYPRIYVIAQEIVQAATAPLDIEKVKTFIQGYQKATPLTMGELWAVPTMLRMAILGVLSKVLATLTEEALPPFIVVSPNPDLKEDVIVAHSILSLHTLINQDWKSFFESVSQVEAILQADPVYPQMDFQTRDQYRSSIERLAALTGKNEAEIAQQAIALSQAESKPASRYSNERISHVGFYLLGQGRPLLEAQVSYRPSLKERLKDWGCNHTLIIYLSIITLVTASFVGVFLGYAHYAGGTPFQMIALSLLGIIPASTISIALIHHGITHTIPPRTLPKMALEEGIPPDCRTMIVIPALVSSMTEATALLHQLELHYLGNIEPYLTFALLTDFPDAPQPDMPEEAALLEQLKSGIQSLNEKYGQEKLPFYLFHRTRRWNPQEECWMGWERKRGKLVEFNRLLTGKGRTTYAVKLGDLRILPKVKYVITLDADTIMPRDGARRMVATLSHPLNHAEFDSQNNTVIAGYTVLQPRVDITLTSANQTFFSRIFSGDTGIDLYTRAVSDVYQDLFGEGIYTGKGIYDVTAFERSLHGRTPENHLLSHDLFEGIHGRAALVTDIVLYEDYPSHYLAYTRRLHRWVRGDWQIFPWLWPKVPGGTKDEWVKNRLSLLDRWKILDNLRRSLIFPFSLLFFTLGWLWFPGNPWFWMIIGLLTIGMPTIITLFSDLWEYLKTPETPLISFSTTASLLRWLLKLVFLPYEGLIMLDAIVTTLSRMYLRHKRMLQWTTAAHTVRLFGKETKIRVTLDLMARSPLFSVIIALLIAYIRPASLLCALPLLLSWFLAPWIAYRISQPLTHDPAPLPAEEIQHLRCLARRTWHYFEKFVGPEDHWLPPDHFQEEPRGLVAHRTSPTNIGLMILAILAAHDLGHIGLLNLALWMRSTFDSLRELNRYRGHFVNWYDTQTRMPLSPSYVSTVDSGNLAGALIAFRQGCLELPKTVVLRWERFQSLIDAIVILKSHIEGLKIEDGSLESYLQEMQKILVEYQQHPQEWYPLLQRLHRQIIPELNQVLLEAIDTSSQVLDAGALTNIQVWAKVIHTHVKNMQEEVSFLLPWLSALTSYPDVFKKPGISPSFKAAWEGLKETFTLSATLGEIPALCKEGSKQIERVLAALKFEEGVPDHQVGEAQSWCHTLQQALVHTRLNAETLLIAYRDVSEDAQHYIRTMDFKFLMDKRRLVFHIGYNVETERLDEHYYDLLASEARLASFVAIAKGDAPQRHWMHMNRPIAQFNGRQGLLSWSGTMFEYLMPTLLMKDYSNTLLGQSYRAAVEHQIRHGKQQHVPWGVSESGYYRFDAAMNYQYKAFGVPGLGLKRGLGQELVITPYASLLALPLSPQEVMRNVKDLIAQGLLGGYGFYEAVDYTRPRLPAGQQKAIVKSYLVHHQGMIFLSLSNYLQHNQMIERFHADPHIQSVNLLLQEQAPERPPLTEAPTEMTPTQRPLSPKTSFPSWEVPVETAPLPQVHTLSNGRYSLLMDSAGGGYSWWKSTALTRWQADATLDNWGNWVYIEDLDSGWIWSVGKQPTGIIPAMQNVRFAPHQIEFYRHDHAFYLQMIVTISPDDDVELRHLTLTNNSSTPRTVRLTSYAEVVLSPLADAQRHPAFNKLFIESEYLPSFNALLFQRRPRSPEEDPPTLAHSLVVERPLQPTGAYESDRMHFLGRGGSLGMPAALRNGKSDWLSKTAGATLDPIMALGQTLTLEPYTSTKIALITCAAPSRVETLEILQRYQSWFTIDQAFEHARTRQEMALRQLNFGPNDLEITQQLLSALLYPHPALRASPDRIAMNDKGQAGLWPFAISGDYPILLVKIDAEEKLPLLRTLLHAHAYWRNQQLKIDLVILNEKESGYNQELQGILYRLLQQLDADAWLNQRGGIFLLRADQMHEEEAILLETVARVILDGKQGSLRAQLAALHSRPTRLPDFMPMVEAETLPSTEPIPRPQDLIFDNGLGGFTPGGKEYCIYLEPGMRTPAPWINVIANPSFGFLISELGGGYTWAENSGENRLTPWYNDPVLDPPGEACYLRDEETGEVWAPTPMPAGAPVPHLIRHGAGYTTFEHASHGLNQQLRLFAALDTPVKIIQLKLENTWKRPRRITATYYTEWVLGTDRQAAQLTLVPDFNSETGAILARNPYNAEFGDRVAFLTASESVHGFTCDRTEFLGERGDRSAPKGLKRIGLSNTFSPGLDPCAALQVHVNLNAGECKTLYFLLGEGRNEEEALALIQLYKQEEMVKKMWEKIQAFWETQLSTITVETPDPAMDILLNRWLLYQTLACRIWGRSAFYQSSGAFGYRDQLQDVLALLYADPDITRDHIFRAARHQFIEGDVLHWWHPPSGRGVRTRYSDDLLWLPFVTATYVATTGDTTILSETIPFVRGPELEAGETERYDLYPATEESYTLLEHCKRALARGTTWGPHDLPLMGSGDWNDGMNRVGRKGKGESIWLGWFLYATLIRFAELCERVNDKAQAEAYRRQAKRLQQALERHAWDGAWYLRAFYDDGTPLGSAENQECQIDAIAQSWAVLSEAATQRERVQQAMQSVDEQLISQEAQIIRLFTPPFDETPHDPGYIKGYPPGIRENGGQYTHAALWTVWAFAALGDGDHAVALFELLNPILHGDNQEKALHYCVEPYVVAADVYSEPPHTGRGGWTWYTGSAGWMYRLGIEAILGLKVKGETFTLQPCIPKSWNRYTLHYARGKTLYHIQVGNPTNVNQGIKEITLDGELLPDKAIPCLDDGHEHQVRILMG